MTAKNVGLSAASAVLIGGAMWFGAVSTRQDTVVPLRVETKTIPNGYCGEPYRAVIQVSGGTPPYSFGIPENTLPNWLTATWGNNQMVLTGTPPVAGPDGTCGGPLTLAGKLVEFRPRSWGHDPKRVN